MCDFSQTHPYLFFSPGEACGGHGRCDAVTSTCVCEENWVSRTDFLDFSGKACIIPVIFDSVMWSIAALMWLRLLIQTLPVVAYQVRLFRRRLEERASSSSASKGRRHYLESLGVLSFLLPWILLVLPAIVASMVVRAATSERMGLDAAVSFLYTFGPAFQWMFVAYGQHLLFRNSLLGSLRVRNNEFQAIARRHLVGLVSASFVYFILSGVFTIAPVYLPTEDYQTRIGFIVARNVCLIALLTYHALHSRYVTKALSGMLHAMEVSPVNDGGTHDRIARVLKDMMTTTRLQTVLALGVTVLFLVFSVVPQLWPFNFVAWACVFSVGPGRNHTLHTWAEKETTKSSSLNEGANLSSSRGAARQLGGNDSTGSTGGTRGGGARPAVSPTSVSGAQGSYMGSTAGGGGGAGATVVTVASGYGGQEM